MRRVLFGLMTLACALWFVPGAFAEEDVKAILEKAIKAHGGAEKLTKSKGMQTKSKGKLEIMGGLDFTQEVTVNYSGKFKEVMDLDIAGMKVNITTVYDGKNGSVKANGQEVPLSDALKKELQEAAFALKIARFPLLLTDKSLKLSALGESKVEDRPAVGVKVAREGHRDLDLYFDKESGLLVKVQTRKLDSQTMQEVDEERIIKEYQDVDGIKAAKKVLVNHDGKKFLEAEVSDTKFLDEVDDSEFQKP